MAVCSKKFAVYSNCCDSRREISALSWLNGRSHFCTQMPLLGRMLWSPTQEPKWKTNLKWLQLRMVALRALRIHLHRIGIVNTRNTRTRLAYKFSQDCQLYMSILPRGRRGQTPGDQERQTKSELESTIDFVSQTALCTVRHKEDWDLYWDLVRWQSSTFQPCWLVDLNDQPINKVGTLADPRH
jgi:hypothetical protein